MREPFAYFYGIHTHARSLYAIIDVETTGGNAKTGKITEIAIFIHDGEKITDEYSTLINPEISIPRFITNLTGIDNEMVQRAPRFFEVAKKIVEITADCVFVGHNVLFDYSFVKSEFSALGYEYKRRTLCTVRLGRKLLPGKRSYSLGKLCKELGIPLDNAHRASADARATVTLFEKLMEVDQESHESNYTDPYASLVKANSLLTHEIIFQLPEQTGVYRFYDHKESLIYIGKSTNIRQRVLSHFRSTSTRRAQEMKEAIARIDFDLTGSELIALLMESQMIKDSQPKFNRAQRRTMAGIGLYAEYNWEGYVVFRIDSTKKNDHPITTFRSKEAAKKLLFQWVEEFELCQKLCGLYDTQGACFQHSLNQCKGACVTEEDPTSYNLRANQFIDKFRHEYNSFFVVDKGRQDEENGLVMVKNGEYLGYGFTDSDVSNQLPEETLEKSITPCMNTRTAHQIIKSFINSNDDLEIIPI